MMRKRITAAILAAAITVCGPPVTVQAAHPCLVDTTAYIEGTVCCRGVRPRNGIVAGRPEWYGKGIVVYEAVRDTGGRYRIGDILGIFECLDTGYGRSTRDGVQSTVRPDKGSRGTIETGETVDVWRDSYSEAVEWMELTGGKCFIQVVDADG